MAPSCVPATNLETSGNNLTSIDLTSSLSWNNTVGLGEVMNFPSVLSADKEVLAKLETFNGRVIDGHAQD
jgi:adenine deaminase